MTVTETTDLAGLDPEHRLVLGRLATLVAVARRQADDLRHRARDLDTRIAALRVIEGQDLARLGRHLRSVGVRPGATVALAGHLFLVGSGLCTYLGAAVPEEEIEPDPAPAPAREGAEPEADTPTVAEGIRELAAAYRRMVEVS